MEHKNWKEAMAELSAVVSKHKGGFKLKSDNWIKVSASVCSPDCVCACLFSGGSPA